MMATDMFAHSTSDAAGREELHMAGRRQAHRHAGCGILRCRSSAEIMPHDQHPCVEDGMYWPLLSRAENESYI